MSRPICPSPRALVVPIDGSTPAKHVGYNLDAKAHPRDSRAIVLSLTPATDGAERIDYALAPSDALTLSAILEAVARTRPTGCDDTIHGAILLEGSCLYCERFVAGGTQGGRA